MPAGEVKIVEEGAMTMQPRLRMRDRLRGRGRESTIDFHEGICIDFRYNSPQNWSHLLNQHIPLLSFVESALGCHISDINVIFPKNMPSYGRDLLMALGINAYFTDGPVRGSSVKILQNHGNIHRPHSNKWINSSSILERLNELGSSRGTLPQRILIARRGSRTILNQEEVEIALRQRGFETIYAEDLHIADQLRLFSECETIVAIHGAALGLLLYRPSNSTKVTNIVEIIPCGIASDIFRMMAQQVGCRWIGVRGKIKPRYVKSAYNMKQKFFSEFQNDSFEVDPVSLLSALDHVWNADNFRVAPLKEPSASHL
ncbi:glycosyltransferase family 61 protein [Paracoccus sp. 11-3]|uniref:Glycosyltransferase family 61 protein n=1 Tax=Paracoccus amoyensis TaxID=2760093 RepID=A0A926GFD8_9RHOB|nr:glycosyltransferase family 61 protein [Paracoccus amoyensis]MBC9246329.1 glycosyltransferase family 61 protein [Paracoccus amoyensis]